VAEHDAARADRRVTIRTDLDNEVRAPLRLRAAARWRLRHAAQDGAALRARQPRPAPQVIVVGDIAISTKPSGGGRAEGPLQSVAITRLGKVVGDGFPLSSLSQTRSTICGPTVFGAATDRVTVSRSGVERATRARPTTGIRREAHEDRWICGRHDAASACTKADERAAGRSPDRARRQSAPPTSRR